MWQKRSRKLLLTGCLTLTLGCAAVAQTDASAASALSAFPLASAWVGSQAAASVAEAASVLAGATATLVVKTVESTARGTLFVLERASDGARISVEIVGKGVGAVSVVTGAVVTSSVISAGIVLSIAGEVVAFIPNELGRALLHNEQLTR